MTVAKGRGTPPGTDDPVPSTLYLVPRTTAMPDPVPSTRASGTLALVVGVLALVGYGVLGASPSSPGLPTGQLGLAALLIIAGVALRQDRIPRWGEFLTGALVGLLAYDLLNRLLG